MTAYLITGLAALAGGILAAVFYARMQMALRDRDNAVSAQVVAERELAATRAQLGTVAAAAGDAQSRLEVIITALKKELADDEKALDASSSPAALRSRLAALLPP